METVPKGPTGMRKTHCQNKKFTILITGIYTKKEKRNFMNLYIMDVPVVV